MKMAFARPEHRAEQRKAVSSLSRAFEAALQNLADSGFDLTVLDTNGVAQDLAVKVTSIALSPWADSIGPCYVSSSLQREIGLTRAGISKAALERRLLRLKTADGHFIYPAFQVRDGKIIDELAPVLRALNSGIDDPWTWAQWLNAPVPGQADGRRHIDELADGLAVKVLTDAERTAAAWAA